MIEEKYSVFYFMARLQEICFQETPGALETGGSRWVFAIVRKASEVARDRKRQRQKRRKIPFHSCAN